jgi:hypothetical protein
MTSTPNPQVQRDTVYTAAAMAMLPWADDAELDVFEWRPCQQCPHPGFACPCSGRPWPSAAVRAAIDAALATRDTP